MRNPAGIRA
jgi:diamine N-acetyltransferase